jgi:hypothetical protein
VTIYRHGVKIRLFGTEQVQSALQTVWYRTGTVCITNCATEEVQSALPEVQHSGHMLGKDVVQLGLRVGVPVAPVQEVPPLASQQLQTEPHTNDHICTVSVRGCGRMETGLEF